MSTPHTPDVCFVDTETTGLDPDRHEIWEVGLITRWARAIYLAIIGEAN